MGPGFVGEPIQPDAPMSRMIASIRHTRVPGARHWTASSFPDLVQFLPMHPLQSDEAGPSYYDLLVLHFVSGKQIDKRNNEKVLLVKYVGELGGKVDNGEAGIVTARYCVKPQQRVVICE